MKADLKIIIKMDMGLYNIQMRKDLRVILKIINQKVLEFFTIGMEINIKVN